ncbi:hypothetical protein PYJP_19030 [Pyrofollis japonicus]|uniref:hypothetical protein n=1 Tax=Pyrofollis japonicus TaxID=3060460 RepID=UPI00295BBB8E|nr:hypothetical protein [Pyrofollis japonicus]BEP18551.1 hypothetical protein PYJP_19030 [Pyrofollis japonicus]
MTTSSRVEAKKTRSEIKKQRMIGGILATIGYILSPLSWWNDAIVNIPLSLAIAYLLNKAFGLNKLAGFYLGYMFTNVLGMYLLLYGGMLAVTRKAKLSKRDVVISSLVSLVYTIAASIILRILGIL